jgi:hypothetical protein
MVIRYALFAAIACEELAALCIAAIEAAGASAKSMWDQAGSPL